VSCLDDLLGSLLLEITVQGICDTGQEAWLCIVECQFCDPSRAKANQPAGEGKRNVIVMCSLAMGWGTAKMSKKVVMFRCEL